MHAELHRIEELLREGASQQADELLRLLVEPGATLFGRALTDADCERIRARGLVGVDLRGIDLRGIPAPGLRLAGASLPGAILADADLRGAHLAGADRSSSSRVWR